MASVVGKAMRTITLRKGESALVDAGDYEAVAGMRWARSPDGYAEGFVRVDGKTKKVYMHRILLSPPADMDVDHINGNRLDNRRCNLRIVTRGQNLQNIRAAKSNSQTGVRNVCWDKKHKRFAVYLKVSGKTKALGRFKTLEEAERAAVEARRLHYTHSPENAPKTESPMPRAKKTPQQPVDPAKLAADSAWYDLRLWNEQTGCPFVSAMTPEMRAYLHGAALKVVETLAPLTGKPVLTGKVLRLSALLCERDGILDEIAGILERASVEAEAGRASNHDLRAAVGKALEQARQTRSV
jgi:hypothetical protein